MNTDKFYAEQIANEYTPKKTSKVRALKRLDLKVKKPAFIFSLTFGIVSSLVLGVGMCFSMGVLGNKTTVEFMIGIAIGIIGILGAVINYPIYKKILTKRKNQYASDIIALANEIASEN